MTAGDLAALAADIAQEAGALAAQRRAEGVSIAASKTTLSDIVTDADREVEQLIRGRLERERPGDGFVGEESGEARSSTGLSWVVDPIDGTVNYAYGIPAFAVSIAVVRGDATPPSWELVAGAVCAPRLGELFTAAQGEGAWLDGQRLSVSDGNPAGALLATGFNYDASTHLADLATIRQVMPMARDLRRSGSAAIDLAYVAAGRLDGYFERGLHPWDLAAGALLVAQAGGIVTQRDGDSARPQTVAAGPGVHAQLTAVLASE